MNSFRQNRKTLPRDFFYLSQEKKETMFGFIEQTDESRIYQLNAIQSAGEIGNESKT